jgi:hypothetical protein
VSDDLAVVTPSGDDALVLTLARVSTRASLATGRSERTFVGLPFRRLSFFI